MMNMKNASRKIIAIEGIITGPTYTGLSGG